MKLGNIQPFSTPMQILLNHTAIVLRPENQADFKNHPLFSHSCGKEATIGGQPFGGSVSLDRAPLGNLHYAPNFSGDAPNGLKDLTQVVRPSGMTDTQFINSLIKSAEAYQNNATYAPIPSVRGESYNSNSFVSGVIQNAGASSPSLPGIAPGYDKPLQSWHFSESNSPTMLNQ